MGEAALLGILPGTQPNDRCCIVEVEALSLRDRLTLHTLPFLACLLNSTPKEALERPLTFQVFDDVEDRRDPRLAKTLFGSLGSLALELDRRNREGAGIFFAVNGTDGMGRAKAHIEALRGWWADLDHKAATMPFRSEELPLAPSLVVRSGHGLHLYWQAREAYGCAGNRTRQELHEACVKKVSPVIGGAFRTQMAALARQIAGLPAEKIESRVSSIFSFLKPPASAKPPALPKPPVLSKPPAVRV